MVNILGISALYHDAACCLLIDGRLVAAAQEERFSRVKNDPRMPVNAMRWCLREAGLDITDIACIGYYEQPTVKQQRQLEAAEMHEDDGRFDPDRPLRLIAEKLGFEGVVHCFPHHVSHAASSFYCSGFEEAAVLTVDGVGEWATTTYGRAAGTRIDLFGEVRFPHSLGLLYATLTAYLGFAVNSGEYKVMGLAPYGEPRYLDRLQKLIAVGEGPGFSLDMTYFDYLRGERMYSEALIDLLGVPPRLPESEISAQHTDIAKSLQVLLEEILLDKVRWLHDETGEENLCMAGGVALNCVANGRIRREGPFARRFIQPAAGDAGSALGAAALAHIETTGERIDRVPMTHAYYGPSWSRDQIAALLADTSVPADDYRDREDALLAAVADALVARKTVGWFHGPMELGPRALGARSILANPLDPEIRDRLNHAVKKREAFRPFAPSVLREHAGDHFDLDGDSPFMLETCQVCSPLALPGITHVDGSARPQTVDRRTNPRFAALIEAFAARTGCPMLVNTSFNVRGEPIVCSPADALLCLLGSGLDLLVLEDFLIERAHLPDHLFELLDAWSTAGRRQPGRSSAISEHLYTFV